MCDTVHRVQLSSCYTSLLGVELSYLLHLYGHLPTTFDVLLELETIDLMATVLATHQLMAMEK